MFVFSSFLNKVQYSESYRLQNLELSYPNFRPKVVLSHVLWPGIFSVFSVKISAERYFKIPHFCSDFVPSSHFFYFIISLLVLFYLLFSIFYFYFLFYFYFILLLFHFTLFFILLLLSFFIFLFLKCPFVQ